jgi:hypothetical protein
VRDRSGSTGGPTARYLDDDDDDDDDDGGGDDATKACWGVQVEIHVCLMSAVDGGVCVCVCVVTCQALMPYLPGDKPDT